MVDWEGCLTGKWSPLNSPLVPPLRNHGNGVLQGPKIFFDSSKDCVQEDTIRWEQDKLIIELVRHTFGVGGAALVGSN